MADRMDSSGLLYLWTKLKALFAGKASTSDAVKSITRSGTTFTAIKADGNSFTFDQQDTWRGIQNNLNSDSTTDSLSAAQGKVLDGKIEHANDDRTIKTYYALAQIGITDSSASVADIYAAMPNTSVMVIDGLFVSNKPDSSNYIIEFIKYNTGRGRIMAYEKTGAETFEMGLNANTNIPTGTWVELATNDQITSLSDQIGKRCYVSLNINGTENDAGTRLAAHWSDLANAIKAKLPGAVADCAGYINFPSYSSSSNLGTYYYWGVINTSDDKGTIYLTQYHANSGTFMVKYHGTNSYDVKNLDDQIGTLSSLTTTAKNNVVSAVNEVNGNIEKLHYDTILNNQTDKDLNNYKTTRSWRIGNLSQCTHAPDLNVVGEYGIFLVDAYGVYISQTFIGNKGTAIRNSYNGGTNWNGWMELALNSNITLTNETSQISKNSTYISNEFTTLYSNESFSVLSVCFQLISDISQNTDLYTGLPNNSIQCYCSLAKNDGKAARARVYYGKLQFEDAQTTGWYNGMVIIPNV